MRKKPQDIIQFFDTPVPVTEEMERRVIGDAICYPENLGDIIPVIHPSFFTSEDRATIWDTIVNRYNGGQVIDITIGMVIGMDLFKTEVLPYTDGTNSGSEAIFHAMQLRDAAAKRRAYLAATQFLIEAVKPGSSEQDLIAAVEGLARSVEGPAPMQGERKLDEVLEEVKDQIARTAEAEKAGETIRVTTGFESMDLFLNGGLKSGQLVILAARPSVGKTAVMLQMAKAAAKAGNPVQVFSLEMQADELAERLMYSTGQVTPRMVNHGDVPETNLRYADGMLKPLPFYINDFSRSLDDIVSRLTQAVKKGRCKVAFIDYLGLMQDALNFGNAKLYQVIAKITGTMKAVAKRLRIPIVLLCQLNREAAREDRAPELFDLRDSGSIEQDADIVLMLESKVLSEGNLYVWLRKNRAGKKEVAFVLKPNDTYSAFAEDGIKEGDKIMPVQPQESPVQGTFTQDEEDEPF